jgi:hypothetical protein
MTPDATTTTQAPDDHAPMAGATCNQPDGTPHPCAADCDHQKCHAGWFARKARADGLVYCCLFHGWLTPQDAFDASWDAYSDLR